MSLQIQRMIREAPHPQRRAFRAPDELEGGLGEALTPAERARLHELLEPRRRAKRPAARTQAALAASSTEPCPVRCDVGGAGAPAS